MLGTEIDVNIEPIGTIIDKPTRADRIKKSVTARIRRKETKIVKQFCLLKEQLEASARLRTRRILEKQKKKRRNLP